MHCYRKVRTGSKGNTPEPDDDRTNLQIAGTFSQRFIAATKNPGTMAGAVVDCGRLLFRLRLEHANVVIERECREKLPQSLFRPVRFVCPEVRAPRRVLRCHPFPAVVLVVNQVERHGFELLSIFHELNPQLKRVS